MSERGAGFGAFLLGLGVGAVLGFLFAPEPGEASRTKLSRKLRGLRDLAAEKAGELGELLDAGDEEEEDTEAPTARVAIERRLTEAKRRRRGAKGAGLEEEDEPLA
jgi:gas vesicle protein